MTTTKVTSKGQITIPVEICSSLKLGVDDRIAFEVSPTGGFTFKPEQKLPVTALKGMVAKLTKPVSIEEMNIILGKRIK